MKLVNNNIIRDTYRYDYCYKKNSFIWKLLRFLNFFRNYEAILNESCRDILSDVENIDNHLNVLEGLASTDHLLFMLGHFIL